jgi:hypothetical protein
MSWSWSDHVSEPCLITPHRNDHQTQDHIMISHDICQLARSLLFQRSPAARLLGRRRAIRFVSSLAAQPYAVAQRSLAQSAVLSALSALTTCC